MSRHGSGLIISWLQTNTPTRKENILTDKEIYIYIPVTVSLIPVYQLPGNDSGGRRM